MKSSEQSVMPSALSRAVIVAVALIAAAPRILAAAEGERRGVDNAGVFERDVFDDWGRWPTRPDRLPYFAEPVFAYRAYLTDIGRIPSIVAPQDCPPLPDALIIPPGTYQFRGRAFSLEKEGLHRFLEPGEELQQRIVYVEDPHALLSGIAWIVSHGRPDGGKSPQELAERAKTRKLFMTCGSVSAWAISVLQDHGFHARSVSSLTLENWNTYDNGHAMLEMYRQDLGKWVLYDVTANAYFTWQDKPLTLIEFAYAVMADYPYVAVPIAADTTLDVSGFRSRDGKADFTFHAERIFADSRQWYRRILEVPMIGGHFFDEEHRQQIERSSPSCKYLDKSEFRRMFYGEPPSGK